MVKFNHDCFVTVSGKRSVYSGAVVFSGDEFKINVGGWYCVIKFEMDGGGSRYVTSLGADHELIITLYNHSNTLDDCVYKPFSIANMGEDKIYMTYTTNLIDPSDKVRAFQYTLWMDVK
ncbi:DUF6864 domain-containing function [Pseudomonas sp. S1(2024)]|uniref:DUF6864 domain-containing function n=1 Tax=Pseudomonas sp. S1(2024) TaxID=3390191 RepID=UPI00397A78AA